MKIPNRKPDRKNERGNDIYDSFIFGTDRYIFDFDLCSHRNGWRQYDTDQDAPYFGVWVNPDRYLVVTYAEGDLSIVDCHNKEGLRAELASMAEFYGPPPAAFTVIDSENNVTKYIDSRPEL
jgi:hypothetical protein